MNVWNHRFMDATRRRELTQVAGLTLGAMALRLLLGAAFDGPTIFTDEYQYVEMARSLPEALAKGKGLYWDQDPALFPCWLYPMLIAPFINLLSWSEAYGAIRFMNAGLMSLAVFPVYGLTRELADHRRALAAAALTMLMPATGYSSMIMTEGLFFPIFLLAMWAAYRAVLTPTAGRRLAAGLIFGLAFHVKPHGLLIPVMLGGTVMIFEADRLRGEGLTPRAWLARYAAGVGRHWLTALGWALVILPRLYVVKFMEWPGEPLTLKNILGAYGDTARGVQAFGKRQAADVSIMYALGWLWCAGVLPGFTLAAKSWGALRRREAPAMRLLAILTLTSTAVMLAVVIRHTLINNATPKLHERYFFIIVPLTLAVFCAGTRTLTIGRIERCLWAATVIAMALLQITVARRVAWTLPFDTPSFTNALTLLEPFRVAPGIHALFAALVAFAALSIRLRKTAGFRGQCLAAGALLAACNTGWYGFHAHTVAPRKQAALEVARKVDREVREGDQLLILKDALADAIYLQAGIRNAGQALAVDWKTMIWWEKALEFEDDGQIKGVEPGRRTWLLASNAWKTSRKPARGYDTCALWRVDDKEPLRLDRAQAWVHLNNSPTTDTVSDGRGFLKDLKLRVVEKNVPTAWVSGQTARVTLTVRNESAFTLPGGGLKMAIGYHWSDPEGTGSWESVVWDDGRQAPLREWMNPGETCEVALDVLAPERHGKSLALTLCPVLIYDNLKYKRIDKTWDSAAGNVVVSRVEVRPAPQVEKAAETR